MKISHSSSLFLATLAVSSSTLTLAAPANLDVLEHSRLPSSASRRNTEIQVPDGGEVDFKHSDSPVIQKSGVPTQGKLDVLSQGTHSGDPAVAAEFHRRGLLDSLTGLIDSVPVLGSILGPLLDQILGTAKSAVGAQSIDDLSPENRDAIKQAFMDAASQMGYSESQYYRRGLYAQRITQWDAVADSPTDSSAEPTSPYGSPYDPSYGSSDNPTTPATTAPASTATNVDGSASGMSNSSTTTTSSSTSSQPEVSAAQLPVNSPVNPPVNPPSLPVSNPVNGLPVAPPQPPVTGPSQTAVQPPASAPTPAPAPAPVLPVQPPVQPPVPAVQPPVQAPARARRNTAPMFPGSGFKAYGVDGSTATSAVSTTTRYVTTTIYVPSATPQATTLSSVTTFKPTTSSSSFVTSVAATSSAATSSSATA